MTTRFHFPLRHPAIGHPHAGHGMFPLREFVVGHPYAPDWLLLTLVSIAALLLWVWNS